MSAAASARRSRGKKSPPVPVAWEQVLNALRRFYHGGEDWRVPYLREHAETPFQVLIGTILSQRTRDETTDAASARLFRAYPTAEALARAPVARLASLIKPVGFYPTKAKGIRDCARAIVERHQGNVPRTMEDLLALPMVGRKTANCTLVFGFGVPAIPVDTHVHRIANRLGAVRTRDPEETEEALEGVVPRDLWIPINPLLVQHGQNICQPLRPKCALCPIVQHCETGRAWQAGQPATGASAPAKRLGDTPALGGRRSEGSLKRSY